MPFCCVVLWSGAFNPIKFGSTGPRGLPPLSVFPEVPSGFKLGSIGPIMGAIGFPLSSTCCVLGFNADTIGLVEFRFGAPAAGPSWLSCTDDGVVGIPWFGFWFWFWFNT